MAWRRKLLSRILLECAVVLIIVIVGVAVIVDDDHSFQMLMEHEVMSGKERLKRFLMWVYLPGPRRCAPLKGEQGPQTNSCIVVNINFTRPGLLNYTQEFLNNSQGVCSHLNGQCGCCQEDPPFPSTRGCSSTCHDLLTAYTCSIACLNLPSPIHLCTEDVVQLYDACSPCDTSGYVTGENARDFAAKNNYVLSGNTSVLPDQTNHTNITSSYFLNTIQRLNFTNTTFTPLPNATLEGCHSFIKGAFIRPHVECLSIEGKGRDTVLVGLVRSGLPLTESQGLVFYYSTNTVKGTTFAFRSVGENLFTVTIPLPLPTHEDGRHPVSASLLVKNIAGQGDIVRTTGCDGNPLMIDFSCGCPSIDFNTPRSELDMSSITKQVKTEAVAGPGGSVLIVVSVPFIHHVVWSIGSQEFNPSLHTFPGGLPLAFRRALGDETCPFQPTCPSGEDHITYFPWVHLGTPCKSTFYLELNATLRSPVVPDELKGSQLPVAWRMFFDYIDTTLHVCSYIPPRQSTCHPKGSFDLRVSCTRSELSFRDRRTVVVTLGGNLLPGMLSVAVTADGYLIGVLRMDILANIVDLSVPPQRVGLTSKDVPLNLEWRLGPLDSKLKIRVRCDLKLVVYDINLEVVFFTKDGRRVTVKTKQYSLNYKVPPGYLSLWWGAVGSYPRGQLSQDNAVFKGEPVFGIDESLLVVLQGPDGWTIPFLTFTIQEVYTGVTYTLVSHGIITSAGYVFEYQQVSGEDLGYAHGLFFSIYPAGGLTIGGVYLITLFGTAVPTYHGGSKKKRRLQTTRNELYQRTLRFTVAPMDPTPQPVDITTSPTTQPPATPSPAAVPVPSQSPLATADSPPPTPPLTESPIATTGTPITAPTARLPSTNTQTSPAPTPVESSSPVTRTTTPPSNSPPPNLPATPRLTSLFAPTVLVVSIFGCVAVVTFVVFGAICLHGQRVQRHRIQQEVVMKGNPLDDLGQLPAGWVTNTVGAAQPLVPMGTCADNQSPPLPYTLGAPPLPHSVV